MTLIDGTIVTVVGYGYRVEWENGNAHLVSKAKRCHCFAGSKCLAVKKVEEFLQNGGERAPEYPPNYFLSVPANCPICKYKCVEYPALDFTEHGVGWACEKGGTSHYWQARAIPMQLALLQDESPHWVISPVISPEGKVLYAGIATEDFLKAREEARHWYYGEE